MGTVNLSQIEKTSVVKNQNKQKNVERWMSVCYYIWNYNKRLVFLMFGTT